MEDFFTIKNKGIASSVLCKIEGNLSPDAKIIWSESINTSDSTSKNPKNILLPKGTVSIAEYRYEYYHNMLYVKYVPVNDSTSGDLKIKIEI